MNQQIIDALKEFDWLTIITKGNKLEDLNYGQWRFLKGYIAELIVEKYSGPQGLKYVGQHHKDYDWPRFNLSVELKSQFSKSMYGKRGFISPNFRIKFNNSNGTNKQNKLDPSQVADILLVVQNNGAFAADKQTVIDCSDPVGDGFDVILPKSKIIEITGKVSINNFDNFNLQEQLINVIRKVI